MHVMIDLETLGTRPGSVILSIGACAFESHGFEYEIPDEHTFYQNISVESSKAVGLTVDQATIDWWKKQSEVAKDALRVDQIPVRDALAKFTLWFRKVRGKHLWSHGATFDIPLIEAACRAVEPQILPPWKFWDARDTRTIYDLAGIEPDRSSGTHHNALDDSINQARAVQQAYNILKGNN